MPEGSWIIIGNTLCVYQQVLEAMKVAFYGDSLTAGIPGASYVEKIRQQVPLHTIYNYGKINDTALSLYHRIRTQHLDQTVDIAFIFVGVNDLLVEQSQVFSRIRRYWARNDDEFRQHYLLLLEMVGTFARRVICVSPLFIGESFNSYAQQRLGHRAAIIEALTRIQPQTEYLDIRSTFIEVIRHKTLVADFKRNMLKSLWDALMYRSDTAILQISDERGLHYTIDGVHLNMAGAEIVAVACLGVLYEISVKPFL